MQSESSSAGWTRLNIHIRTCDVLSPCTLLLRHHYKKWHKPCTQFNIIMPRILSQSSSRREFVCSDSLGGDTRIQHLQRNNARNHQARMDTWIEGGASTFNILWTRGESGTMNGKWCDARGDEWEGKVRKAKNKIMMAGQCEQLKLTFHVRRHRSCQIEKCYRGCRQGSDTRWTK